MQLRSSRIVRRYVLLPAFALLSGIAATAYSHAELKDAPGKVLNDWPKVELHQAAQAALQYRAHEGRLPATLSELKSASYLPKEFDLPGVMYFRDSEDRPRLSWRDDDDGATAFCSLNAAIHEQC